MSWRVKIYKKVPKTSGHRPNQRRKLKTPPNNKPDIVKQPRPTVHRKSQEIKIKILHLNVQRGLHKKQTTSTQNKRFKPGYTDDQSMDIKKINWS